MSEYLSRVDFVWPWVWLLLLLPLVGRFFMAKARPLKEYVRVPFLPARIHEIQPISQPVRSGKLAAVVFWLVWGLLVCAMARPEWLTPPQHIEKPMRNIMLILDVSGSMAKNDVAGGSTRLEAVQAAVCQRMQTSFSRPITFSMGVVLCPQHISFREVFGRADREMYRAKENRRDAGRDADDGQGNVHIEFACAAR